MARYTWLWEYPKWTNLVYDEMPVMRAVLAANAVRYRLLGFAEAFDKATALRFAASVMEDDGMGTSAIEGEMLNRDSVRSSVARHLKLSTAGLPEPEKRAAGVVEMVYDAAHNYSKPLTTARLFRWHAGLFSGEAEVTRGAWRSKGAMRVVSLRGNREIVHFEAPANERVPMEMEKFLDWFETPAPTQPGPVRAAIAHLRYLTIHPFEDGNGRTARALTDLLLAREECRQLRFFSLAMRLLKQRKEYYEILEKSQRGGTDVTEWVLWFVAQIEAACRDSLGKIKTVFERDAFWIRHRATDISLHQRKVLNRMLDEGATGFVGGINVSKYASIAGVSTATASRDLADLVEKKCLLPLIRAGKHAAYALTQE